MHADGYALFDTAIGVCAVAWNVRGLAAVQLPEGDEAAARARLRRRFPGAEEAPPPPEAAQAIGLIRRLLEGEAVDLTPIRLDLEGVPAFERSVYQAIRRVPPGTTVTYGDLARELGDATQAQAVGQALGRNPFPIVAPCHRVVAAGGRSGGFSARGGVATKLRLLAIEGSAQPGLFDL